jgi:hypothetical protein
MTCQRGLATWLKLGGMARQLRIEYAQTITVENRATKLKIETEEQNEFVFE